MENNLLIQYAYNQENPEANWALALYYENIGQTAAALSFFLRTAERAKDNLLKYESLIKGALCYYTQGSRNFTVRGLLQQAVTVEPTRPEAYYWLSVVCENSPNWDGNWYDAYTNAVLGLQYVNDVQDELRTNIYPGPTSLYVQRAHTAWHCGLCDLSRDLFLDLYQNHVLEEHWSNIVYQNLVTLNAFSSKSLTLYKAADHDKLFTKFSGSDQINKNYSEAYQDMFVLTMLNGRRDGTYLEIGAGDPFYGSNTALLEELGWSGIGVDLDTSFVEAHNQNRKNKCVVRDATTIDYDRFLTANGFGDTIDYLQIDVDPADVSMKVLMSIPFETRKFAVITFEHDHYTNPKSTIREDSRRYLKAYGYELIAGNISPDNNRPYEDWFIHPDLVTNYQHMIVTEKDVIMAKDYMENNI